MTAQQKLDSMMNHKDQVMDNGDTPGFIDRYLSKKQIIKEAIKKKAESSFADDGENQPQLSAVAPQAHFALASHILKAKPVMPTMIAQKKKIEPAKIAQLDMNTIGDSDDTVTALQEQLKKAEKEEEMKIELKKALTEKLTAKKEQAPPVQNATATAQQTKESENTATQANTNNQEQTTITEIKSDGITLHKVEKAKKPAVAPAANVTASAAVQKKDD